MGIFNLVTLEGLKGSRSQLTALATALLNLFVSLHFIELTPEQLTEANTLLASVFAYFLADKFSGGKK